MYLREARSSVDLSLAVPKSTEDLQAVALLCVTGLEMGDAALLQQYLGLYHGTVASQNIPDFDGTKHSDDNDDDPGDGDGDGDEDVEWLTGWNFVTDLYRGLEHLMAKFRPRRLSKHHSRTARSTALPTMFLVDFDPESKILLPLKDALENLPDRFRNAQPISTNVAMNRCGFQATNIVCTYQVRNFTHQPHDKAGL
ncbi:hypothetical protein SCUCBS95973_009076 [Sporothrix curviconia]|uniref:Uncharacterized protein n=1 Tax=Sporothrix curviconia TaxID=1260050 RepID=A0ABP0CV67_9PEZI